MAANCSDATMDVSYIKEGGNTKSVPHHKPVGQLVLPLMA